MTTIDKQPFQYSAEANPSVSGGFVIKGGTPPTKIATVHDSKQHVAQENAALFAAAPDMKDLLQGWEASDYSWGSVDRLRTQTRNLLAKLDKAQGVA